MAKGKKDMKNNKGKAKKKDKLEKKEFLSNEVINKMIIILVILSILGIFYLITVKITGNDTKNEEEAEEETVIQSEEILVGSSFNRSDKEYVVVYYDMSDTDLDSDLDGSISNYKQADDSLPLYKVDMSNVFNKKYSTDGDSNKSPKDASELSIKGPTLIIFSDGSVKEYIEGKDEVLSYLG